MEQIHYMVDLFALIIGNAVFLLFSILSCLAVIMLFLTEYFKEIILFNLKMNIRSTDLFHLSNIFEK